MTTRETIIKVVEQEEVTFVQADTPAVPVVDKYALKKLLFNKPPEQEPKRVKVTRIRCDRRFARTWAVYDTSGSVKHHFDAGIVANASLSSKEVPAMGCGGGSDWIGMASGEMVSKGQPVTVPEQMVRRLYFDRDSGSFHDKETGAEITSCDYLILKPDCHAEYIAAPKGEA